MGEYLGNHLRGGQAHPQVQPSHPARIPSTIPSISCVLAPGTPSHPLFRPCPAVMAPLCEGYNAQITLWYLALQPLKFKMVYRPGVQMVMADFFTCFLGDRVGSTKWILGLSQAEEGWCSGFRVHFQGGWQGSWDHFHNHSLLVSVTHQDLDRVE